MVGAASPIAGGDILRGDHALNRTCGSELFTIVNKPEETMFGHPSKAAARHQNADVGPDA